MAEEVVITKYVVDVGEFNARFIEMENRIKTNEAAIASSQQKTQAALKKTGEEASGLDKQFSALGQKIAAAFAVTALISFANSSVEAFAKAEKASLQLLNALNGNVEAHKRLTKQAKELQANLGIDDDTIVAQQAYLAIQNRTEAQIKKTIQAAVQYAEVFNVDLATAVKELDKTFEGTIGRLAQKDKAFKELSLTELANGAAIDLVNEKYKGFAEAGAAGVAGQLEIQRRRVEELQEALGEKLAPLLLSIKQKFLEAFTLPKNVQDALDKLAKTQEDIDAAKAAKSIPTLKAELEALQNRRSELLKNASANAEALNLNTAQTEKLRLYIVQREKEANAAKDAAESNNKEIETLERLKKQKEDLEKTNEKTATGTKQFANERKEIERLDAQIKALTETEADRQKRLDDARDKAEKETADAFKKKQDENKKSAADSLEIQLANLEKAKQEELGIEATSVQEKLLIDRKYLLEKALLYEDDLVMQAQIGAQIAAIDTKLNDQKLKDATDTAEAVGKQNKDRDQKEIDGKKKVGELSRAEIKKELEDATTSAERREELLKKLHELNMELMREAFDLALNLADQLNSFLANQSSAELEAINTRRDAQTEAIDLQIEQAEEANERGKLSDKQLEDRKKQLLAQRVAAEKKADEESKKIKQKEAEREKAFTIVSILLSTARAVMAALGSVPPNPFLAALAAVTGAAQLAFAIATPIPQFAKGTKGKERSGMGIVGEQGAEMIFMPQGTQVVPADRTQKYKQAIDAMIDNRFEDYVYKTMIAPALVEASKKMEKERQKSFAENIASSFAHKDGLSYYDMVEALGKGTSIKNGDAIGKAIAKHLNPGYSNQRYN